MTGPKPAGRPWSSAEDMQLRELLKLDTKAAIIARKLRRSPGAIYARARSFKKIPSPVSLPSEQVACHAHGSSKPAPDR